eukprot:6574435-Pyramimonas_sp.AAC.1
MFNSTLLPDIGRGGLMHRYIEDSGALDEESELFDSLNEVTCSSGKAFDEIDLHSYPSMDDDQLQNGNYSMRTGEEDYD